MTNTNNTDRTEKLKEHIFNSFGLKGLLSPLDGELDLNFKLVSELGEAFVVKVYAPERDLQFLNFQERLLTHLKSKELNFDIPQFIKTHTGESTSNFIDENQQQRSVCVLSWVPGRLWNHVNPHTETMLYELGILCGKISKALLDFDHPFSHRRFEWDIANGLWVKDYLELFDTAEHNLIKVFISQFEEIQSEYNQLQKSTVHNDANDFNILVSENVFNPKIKGLIDFGDAIYTQVINDLAICCSYAIVGFEDPLEASLAIVKGYHKFFPLEEKAIEYLYICIAIRLVISVTKSRINKLEVAENSYLQVSDKTAWELLKKWKNIDPEFAYYRFRAACGMTPHPQSCFFINWTSNQNISLISLFPSLKKERVVPLDLSISSKWLGQSSDFDNLDWFNYQLAELQKANPDKIIAGGYLERRPLYTDSTYDKIGNNGRESRCMHLGIDFWIPSLTPIHAIYDGTVVVSTNDKGDKKYGGLVILGHQEEGLNFHTLYGHLSAASVKQLKIGDQLRQGEKIGEVGNSNENGNWSPHLHFQFILSLLNYKNDFPGVAYFNEKHIWQSICPNPNLLFNLKELASPAEDTSKELLKARNKNLGRGMSLQYEEPLYIVRGSGVNLIDNLGRKYLDAVNNVAHV